jgi:FMN phosphatase YigB (HAD superfamily)/DNA-binding XRE family transcriptional regulator
MDEKGLGARLQQARKQAGFTQQQLCQKTGLSYSTLAKIERGAIKSPSIFTIQQIAAALNTTVDVLLLGGSTANPAKKHSKTGISFVYFDVNGCLVRFFHRAFTAVAADTGVSSDIVETTFWHYNDAVCRGDMSLAEFNKKLADCFELSSFDWQPYYMDAVSAISETAEVINWVAEHYQVGLLSNIMPGFIPAMKAKGVIPDVAYDTIVDSSVVKAIKPETQIYEIAVKQAGVPAEEILLIDDSRTNLMAAERLGWHVLWFDDYMPAESTKRIKEALEF